MAITINGETYRNLQEQVEENAKDIEELQEQAAVEYSAGDGIDIEEGVISVDDTVALKSELFSGDYDDLTNKPDLTVYATKNELNGYIKDNDTNYASTFRGKGVYVKEEGQYTTTIYGDGTISRSIPRTEGYTYTLPSATGTLALTRDIPTVDAYTKAESDAIFQTKIGMALYATQQQLNLNIAATEARTDLLLAKKQDKLTAGTGITINSDNVVSADSTLARVADIPVITGLVMYNYKITISGLDGGTQNTRSAVYIVSLPYQWDYSSLSKIDIIRKIPVWSVVVDTDISAGSKIMGRFHWQTSAIALIDWVDGTHTVMDFTGSFNATITAAAPAHW